MIDHGFGLSLGPLEERNLPLFRAWRNTYSIWKWCRQNDLIDAPSHKRWFEKVSLDPSIKMYEIISPSFESPVGVCGLTSIDLYNRHAEFSLYIAPDKQGMGFGKQALRTLLHHGFRTLGLHMIWGETFEGNHALKIFEEVGFHRDGIRRDFYFREGKHLDAILVSMRAEEQQWT